MAKRHDPPIYTDRGFLRYTFTMVKFPGGPRHPTEPLKALKKYQQVLSDLPLVYTIVKCGGLAEAAAALGYKGPTALSNRIRRLETTGLGSTIFEGHSNLTTLGDALFRLAEKVIPDFQAFIAELGVLARFRIASVTSVWDRYRRDLQDKSADGAAGWSILDEDVTFINHTRDSIPLVQNGSVDIGIVTYRPKDPLPDTLRITFKPWVIEPMVMVLSRDNSLGIAQNDHNWGRPDLLDALGVVMLETGYGIRDRSVDPYLKKVKKTDARIVAEFKTVAEVKDLVARTPEFIAILPQPTVEGDARLCWSELDGIEKRPVNFIYRKHPRDIVQKFLNSFPEVKR